jgi:hypothetical protein
MKDCTLTSFTYAELESILKCIIRVEVMQDNGLCSGHNRNHMSDFKVQLLYAMSEVKQRENITNN